MRLIKRYNSEINAWEIGYWQKTAFIIVDIVPALEDAQKLYDEEAA